MKTNITGVLFKIGTIIACSVFFASCGNSSFSSDGFKSIKFGMSKMQLNQIGFACETYRCTKDASNASQPDEGSTLFGKPAHIFATLADGKVSRIDVGIGVEAKELVDLFTNAIGNPSISEYTSLAGYKIRQHYWISSDDTSIVVWVNLDQEGKPREGIFQLTGPRSTATYLDQVKTKELLDNVNKSAVKPKDF